MIGRNGSISLFHANPKDYEDHKPSWFLLQNENGQRNYFQPVLFCKSKILTLSGAITEDTLKTSTAINKLHKGTHVSLTPITSDGA